MEAPEENQKPLETRPDQAKAVKNVTIVFIGNVITVIANILVGFLIPKMMGLTDYAWYKTYTLYFDYTDFLSLGFLDGIYLLYAGTSYELLDRKRFRMFSRFMLLSQFVISGIICAVALCLLSTDYGFVFLCVGISSFLSNMLNYFQYLSRITERYKEFTLRGIVKSGLTIAAVVLLFVLFKFGVIADVGFKLYVAIVVGILFLVTLVYAIKYRELLVGASNKMREEKDELKEIFRVGFPILVANLVTRLVLIIDRQFVNVLFDKDTYAVYAFAYSMLGFVNYAISTIATVILPMLKRIPKEKLPEKYNYFIAIISIVVAVCLCGYFPVQWICEHFLQNYTGSLIYLRIVMPGIMLSSAVTIIINNYYKVIGKSFLYFVISIGILVLSFVLNLVAYLIWKDPMWISIASVATYLVWYLVTEIYLVRKWRILPIKNIAYIVLIMAAFYLATIVSNVYISFAIYFGSAILITLAIHFKLIRRKFKSE